MRRIPMTIDINDGENTKDRIHEITTTVCPNWAQSDIHIKPLGGGDVNAIYKVWRGLETDDAIIIRVFKPNLSWIFKPDFVGRAMEAAYQSGGGAEVLASFTNGLVYRFTPGETMDPNKHDDPRIRKMVIKQLAKFHMIKLPGEGNGPIPTPKVHDDLANVLSVIKEDLGFPSGTFAFLTGRVALQAEVDWCLKEVKYLKPKVVFTHGDLFCPNIIINKMKDSSVDFIDFDFSGYNYAVIDICRFITRARLSYDPTNQNWVTPEEEKELCKVYLNETHFLYNESPPTAAEIEVLYEEVVAWKMVYSLYTICAILGIICTDTDNEIYRHHVLMNCEWYDKLKNEFISYKKMKYQA